MKFRSDVICMQEMVQANTTSWFALDDSPGCYALVLEDVDGRPIASASKSYKQWVATFLELQQIQKEEQK
jgi:hypothetical protein